MNPPPAAETPPSPVVKERKVDSPPTTIGANCAKESPALSPLEQIPRLEHTTLCAG